ncbi:MAG: mobilization protein [Gammaproteobacteria bacterium]|nr:MAG: mobilization protein [Gammaproteobacteria bacterium]
MGRVHFIGGEKGGVGKSLTARLLAQYFIDNQLAFIGFDTDQSHGTFSRFYTDFASPIIVEDFDSLDQIVVTAEEHPGIDIIVDLAAQTSRKLEQWIQDSGIFDVFAELGYQVFLWHIMDDGADSMRLLDSLLQKHQHDDVQFVIVCNMGRGENFDAAKQSPTFAKAKERNAKFITLNKLQSRLMQKIDFSNYSFWAAANNTESLNITERQRIKVWLNNSFSELGKALKTDQSLPSNYLK